MRERANAKQIKIKYNKFIIAILYYTIKKYHKMIIMRLLKK